MEGLTTLNSVARRFYKTPNGKYHAASCRYYTDAMDMATFTPEEVFGLESRRWYPHNLFCWQCSYRGDIIKEVTRHEWND